MAARIPPEHRRMIDRKEVLRRTGLSYTQQWRLERKDRFPARIRLTDLDQSHAGAYGAPCRWFEDEIDEWIASRIRVASQLEAAASKATPLIGHNGGPPLDNSTAQQRRIPLDDADFEQLGLTTSSRR